MLGGSIPHITHEVLKMITEEPLGIQVPLRTIMHTAEAVSEFKMGLGKFIGMNECLVYCTVQDPGTVSPQGFNVKNEVGVFTRNGNKAVNAERYMDIMEAFKPDMYQALCDGDTDMNSKKKRVQNSIMQTSKFFKTCLERHIASANLQNSAMLGVIEGGYNVDARKRCAIEMAQKPVFGFVIDGLHNSGPDVVHLEFKEVKPIIECILNHLPDEKLRVVHGAWNPVAVMDLIELGIDVFDSSYPFLISEKGQAFVFLKCIENHLKNEGREGNAMNEIQKIHSDLEEIHLDENFVKNYNGKYELDLINEKYFDDFDPICKHCSCLTCKKHTRSYIHHLLNTQELLGNVLLMIHNLHQYLEFFKAIRRALKEETWSSFRCSFH